MELTSDEILLKYFRTKPAHPYEVKRLCSILFEKINESVTKMPRRELELLHAAAVLHDVGYAIDEKSHNKHSRDIILKEGIKGFSAEEVKIIACLVRYHRGNLPDKDRHKLYGSFSKAKRMLIKRLAGILKFADGLDVEQKPLIKDIEIEFNSSNCILKIYLIKKENIKTLNIAKSLRKRDLLEIGFKCQSVVFVKDT